VKGSAARTLLPLLPRRFQDWWKARRDGPQQWSGGSLAPATPAFVQAVLGVEPLTMPEGREVTGTRRMQVRLLTRGHLTSRMEAWADFSKSRGIEYTYPLLDRRVVEFCLAVPPRLFFKNGWKRWGFRALSEPYVGCDTAWKNRKDDPAMERHARTLGDGIGELLLADLRARREEIRSRGIVDPDAMIEAIENDSGGGDRWLAMLGDVTW